MPDGNGRSRITIDAVPISSRCVRFQAGKPAPPKDELPFWLSRTLNDWLTQHPMRVPRVVLPLVVRGTTVAIDVWYDEAS
jgi:hypothetical protein